MSKFLQSKNKKAFEIQFNWLFILVAGAAILIFFTVILVKQRNISEASTNADVIKSIESIITGAGISKDTINMIEMPNSDIKTSCNKFSLGGASKQYQNLILFAPDLLKGKKLITQTTDFSVPYKAANLLYITSLDARYIIIGDSDLAKSVNKSLPSNLKKEFLGKDSITPSAFQNKNNYKVRFIVFDGIGLESIDLTKFNKMPDSDVTALKVSGDAETGTIEFYEKDRASWSVLKGKSTYLKKSSLLGAVYSDTLEGYECSMKNSFSRLNLVNKVYLGRTKLLKDNAAFRGQITCADLYDSSLADLKDIHKYSLEFTATNIVALANTAKSLAQLNKDAQANSCSLIY